MDVHILEGSLYVTDVLIGGFFGRVWITINDSVHQMVMLVPQVLEVIGPLVQVLEVVVNTPAQQREKATHDMYQHYVMGSFADRKMKIRIGLGFDNGIALAVGGNHSLVR